MLQFTAEVDNLVTSLSFLGLFVVLVWYQYEILYRYMVLMISVLGLWFPGLYLLPYLLIVWRVFVGKNASTDQDLYIGQLVSTDDMSETSDTTRHWVVVVHDRASDRYDYTHAVGRVISGEGEKIPFRHMPEGKQRKYRLVEVGFVTRVGRSLKMRNVVENEVMQSGYSCQEYAVNVAFQLSSSRTYTLVKTMMLLRFRTVTFYALFLLSVCLYLAGHDLARYLNLAVITNVFGAMELSRIGTHNTAQVRVWPVIRAYLSLKRPDFMKLFLISILVVIAYVHVGAMFALCIVFVFMIVVR